MVVNCSLGLYTKGLVAFRTQLQMSRQHHPSTRRRINQAAVPTAQDSLQRDQGTFRTRLPTLPMASDEPPTSSKRQEAHESACSVILVRAKTGPIPGPSVHVRSRTTLIWAIPHGSNIRRSCQGIVILLLCGAGNKRIPLFWGNVKSDRYPLHLLLRLDGFLQRPVCAISKETELVERRLSLSSQQLAQQILAQDQGPVMGAKGR
ncbi:hypothetical protein NDU88_006953 [Pleurodeles waltl]|uniref:Uncharacterized protein n=1 Tax=Pleurodeles waltl TaxID=8319 RepID=A0AAV7LS90_PLEWA|nr:hypothetical protein NDU88_006953 [Pleurodeles waltl]